ncbi:cytidylate kinase family protein [uncultured Corynebacterium sp.]|uniref:cytidylate kinase family protein n=1 Tax=uncultured Corynebacterium sp. TaxID=159447 RepID=UPI0025DDF10F|nr:cytidylate kinase family protein [uncultured Corynebacterium sp.]
MTSTTTAAAPPATAKMPGHRVFTYSLGDAANNLTFMMTSMFLMVFMTEIAGLTAAAAGLIYGVTKVWAGIADLIVGQTADRVNTRWGRLRPFLLFGSTPLAIVFVLLFSVPSGLSMTATIVWILLFDAAFQLAYSFVNIPYGSLSAAMTQDPVDRSKLSGARSIAASLTAVGLSAVISPQFQDTTADGVRLKFTITCLILGVVAVILYLICFANSREVVPRKPGKISFKATFRMLKQNRPLLILCLGAFFLLSAMFTQMAVGVYYARYVLGNAGWYTFLMFANTVGTILVASLVPMLTARMGKRKGYIACAVVYMVGFVFIFFLPAGNLMLAIIAWLLMGIGSGGTNAMMFSMQADTVDYGEWKSDIRSEGGSYSILSFIRKCGQGLGGWLGAAVIGAFGYVAMAAEQTDSAQQGIRMATGLVPAGLTLLAVIVMFFYPLTADLHAKVVTDLNERRTQSNVATRKGVPSESVKVTAVGDGRNTLIRSPEGANQPIITVFGQRGSGASDIAPKVAEALGVPYIGQRFTSDELAQVDRRELISDSGFDRFLRSVELGGAQNSELAAATNIATNRSVAAENTEFVLDAVDGGGVILGRNGALVLGRVVGAMHVRLIAPLGMRVERVMHKTGLSASEATEQCAAEDRIRAELSRALYNWDPNGDEYYDIVINTASVTYEQVVEIIVDLYRSKYPANRA